MARKPKLNPEVEAPPEPMTEPLAENMPEDAMPAEPDEAPWMRGLHMLVFAILFEIAKWLLLIATLLQFLWLLFAKERNTHISEFGESLSRWMARVARFQTAASEDKPFPWRRWGE